MTIHDYSWLFMSIHDFSSLFIIIHHYSSLFHLFITIHQHSSLFITIHHYLSLFITIHHIHFYISLWSISSKYRPLADFSGLQLVDPFWGCSKSPVDAGLARWRRPWWKALPVLRGRRLLRWAGKSCGRPTTLFWRPTTSQRFFSNFMKKLM